MIAQELQRAEHDRQNSEDARVAASLEADQQNQRVDNDRVMACIVTEEEETQRVGSDRAVAEIITQGERAQLVESDGVLAQTVYEEHLARDSTAFKAGDGVIVKTRFQVLDVWLSVGLVGRIIEIDEEGNADICFVGQTALLMVSKEDLDKLDHEVWHTNNSQWYIARKRTCFLKFVCIGWGTCNYC